MFIVVFLEIGELLIFYAEDLSEIKGFVFLSYYNYVSLAMLVDVSLHPSLAVKRPARMPSTLVRYVPLILPYSTLDLQSVTPIKKTGLFRDGEFANQNRPK